MRMSSARDLLYVAKSRKNSGRSPIELKQLKKSRSNEGAEPPSVRPLADGWV
jgi:hypothetical protein